MMDERVYMVASEDEHGDQHMLATESLERAKAAYAEMKARYGNVRASPALADAMGKPKAGKP